MKLTASKMSSGALAGTDSGRSTPGSSRERRLDHAGVLVGASVGVARFGTSGRVGRSFGGVGVTRVGVSGSRVGVGPGNGSGSCKSGKEESRDDFELHFACFFFGCRSKD